MKIKVKVTQDHIKQGKWMSARSCPIALAMDDLPFVDDPTASQVHLSFVDTRTGKLSFFRTPEECAEFMTNFDCHRDVEPFEFEVEN